MLPFSGPIIVVHSYKRRVYHIIGDLSLASPRLCSNGDHASKEQQQRCSELQPQPARRRAYGTGAVRDGCLGAGPAVLLALRVGGGKRRGLGCARGHGEALVVVALGRRCPPGRHCQCLSVPGGDGLLTASSRPRLRGRGGRQGGGGCEGALLKTCQSACCIPPPRSLNLGMMAKALRV